MWPLCDHNDDDGNSHCQSSSQTTTSGAVVPCLQVSGVLDMFSWLVIWVTVRNGMLFPDGNSGLQFGCPEEFIQHPASQKGLSRSQLESERSPAEQ